MASFSIDSVPSHEDAAASEQSSGDFIAEMEEMFAPYHAAYDESVQTVELSRATVYQLAIKLAHEIYERLTLVKSGSIFAKRLIESLWSLTTTRVNDDDDDDDDEEFDPDVNVISVLYNFLTMCGDYPNAPFAATTFGLATMRKKGKYDPNYDISFQKGSVHLGESKFVDIFRAFRSIVSRIIKNSTGSYDVPERAYAHEWGYSIQIKTGVWHRVECTKDFEEFIMALAPVYEELEKFSPELMEVFDVFNTASAAAKAHRAERDAKREDNSKTRDLHAMREKHDRRRPHQAKALASGVVAKPVVVKAVDERPFVLAAPVACRWGIVNPITGVPLLVNVAAPVVVPVVVSPPLIEEPRELSEVTTDGEGEFETVSRQQKSNQRTHNWQANQRAQGVHQAAGEATPRIQRRMDRAHNWREKQAVAK
jgi:hypothetical protein